MRAILIMLISAATATAVEEPAAEKPAEEKPAAKQAAETPKRGFVWIMPNNRERRDAKEARQEMRQYENAKALEANPPRPRRSYNGSGGFKNGYIYVPGMTTFAPVGTTRWLNTRRRPRWAVFGY